MDYSVLIVDDSQTVRAVVKRTLRIINMPIAGLFEAGNGREALEIMRREPVDVVFADINMPVMDGIELIRNMKSDASMQDISIVVLSTEGSITRIKELYDFGVKAFVRKPFSPEKIKAVLSKIVEMHDDVQNEGNTFGNGDGSF